MHKTGIEDYYVIQNQKKLRCGYTTGSCAAAAAKAAAWMLLSNEVVEEAEILTPKGITLNLSVEHIHRTKDQVSCAVKKDGGDDPDATHGLLIYASVTKSNLSLTQMMEHRETVKTGIWNQGMHCFIGIHGKNVLCLDGLEGVGRITKPGLEQPVGACAINKIPRQMIFKEVAETCEKCKYEGALQIMISVPGGEETAQKTFNPRLGIQGGISILGTSGIVVPMSEAALIASIRLEMEMKRAAGVEYLLITPGNYGESFLGDHRFPGIEKGKLDVTQSMKCSNYVGETLDMAVELGFKGVLFVAHIGKFVKVSGGIMNTHSRHADARAELMSTLAIRAGSDLHTAREILDTRTTEEAVEILEQRDLLNGVMKEMTKRVKYYLQHRCGGMIWTEAILFSNNKGYLGETDEAEKILYRLMEQQNIKNEQI